MKMIKSVVLGTAATLVVLTNAQAADLPVKAKAVEYVKVCSLYGAGYYYMPGTDTCIKFGGYVRAEAILGSNNDYGFAGGVTGARNRLSNYYTSRARMDFTVDTRTATEYGVVRTFADLVYSWTDGGYTGSNPSAYDATGTNVGSTSFGLYHAFIQFAGFTMGHTVSIFDAPWTGYPAGGPDTLPGGSNFVTGVNQFAYTADFGQGITGSVALQDQTANPQSNVWNLTGPAAASFVTGVYGNNNQGGSRVPDIIGQVRVDQAWGLAQVAVVGHNNHTAYYGATEPTGHPDDKWGYAVMAALSIKNIPTGPGDSINLQAAYTDGATKYNMQTLFPQAFAVYGSTNLPGAYQSVGIFGLADSVYTTGGAQETVKTWGFRGGYTHNWSPNWATAVYGAYGHVSYGSAGKTAICASYTAVLGLVGTCNPDFNVGVIGGNIVWSPVKNLSFTFDVNWTSLDQKSSGTISGANTAVASVAKPAATYELKDQNMVNALIRAQRNF